MYVIRRGSDGAMLAKRGHKSSYTNNIFNARVFYTRDAAKGNGLCDNEYIFDLSSLVEGF